MTPEHEAWIDLLVDGELDEPRRQELLLALDATPAGWRRCALAFLEVQAWRAGARTLAKPAQHASVASGTATIVAPPMRSRASATQVAGGLFALAASILIAFAAGYGWRGEAPRDGSLPGVVATNKSASTTVPTAADPLSATENSLDGTQLVAIEVDHGQKTRRHTLRLPVSDSAQSREQWLAQAEAAGPAPEVLAELERRGVEINERRQLVPVTLDDGRELIVPVKEVDLQYEKPVIYQ
jgi:hypothetical protein